VIGLGLRLVLSGGREAVTRLVVLAVAVGLGVGLLLTAVAATNAVTSWNNRHAWFYTGTASVPAGPAAPGIAPLWWHPSGGTFNGQPISRFDVAATGTSSLVPPSIPRDPGPGQYYASPAFAVLLRSTPANQLAGRYPGRLAGTIGDAALPSPDSLVIIIGHTPAQLADTPGSVQVTSIAAAVPGGDDRLNPKGLDYRRPDAAGGASSVDLILSVVALAVLAPVLIFIATATRLSAARREERFAAMRLAGATRRQVSLLAAVESTVAGLLGVAAGFGIFFLLRIPVAGIPFIGQPFFPAELSLSLLDILAVAVGVPVAAAVAARLALRRVHISPLGVARRATPRPPRAWRALPLLVGLAELGFWTVHGHPASIPGQVQAFVSSFLLIIVGLVIAGPWLTMTVARLMARRTSRPGTLIAARRLADDPRAAFRAVSGLVLALFITTVAVVAITTQDAKNLTRWNTAAAAGVVTDQLAGQSSFSASQGTPEPAASAAPLAARLGGIPGVQGVIVVRAAPGLTIPATLLGGASFPGSGPVPAGVVSCAARDSFRRPWPLPGRGDNGGVPGRPGRRPVRPGPRRDHLAGRERPGPAAGQPRSGRHQRGDERRRASGRTGQDGAGERTRVSQRQRAVHPRRPDQAGQFHQQRLPAARKRGDPGQPADRRLHARRGHRGRARRPQAAVQPAAAHRCPARHAAPRRRPGKRRPAARRRRRRDRHRLRCRRDVRLRGAAAPDGGARCRVLPPHRRRDPGVARHHRGHLPAAGTHHRTRGREKRMNLLPRILNRSSERVPASRYGFLATAPLVPAP